MRIFVTGASGWVGSAVVPALIAAGHEVTGLARSDSSAAAIEAAGAEAKRGSLDDLESLRSGAAAADGVIHTAFIHDFSSPESMQAAGRADLAAIEAIGEALAGSDRPFVTTAGTGLIAPGRLATERDRPGPDSPASHRSASELATLALAGRGVRSSLVRLPPTVHGDGDKGFVPAIVARDRELGVSAYVGDGSNRWPAVHRLDAAELYRLAVESAPAGSLLHCVAEEGVPIRELAEAIGRGLGVPAQSISAEQAAEQLGFIGGFLAADVPASSAITRELLGWQPTNPGLLEDLAQDHYFRESAPAA